MKIHQILTTTVGVWALMGSLFASDPVRTGRSPLPTAQVVPASEVKWSPLNPARGDKGPQAGALWGDRRAAGPSGFLVRFAEGFSSPPHIHNTSYRAVAISGRLHNDDPGAEPMWMPAGSFWTQPAGEAHITAADGRSNLAYVEIDQGPYLVLPVEEAEQTNERPVNVDASNVVWLDATAMGWADGMSGSRIAFLWGGFEGGTAGGSLVKLPGGFEGEIRGAGSDFRAVVMGGRLRLRGVDEASTLDPGSYFGSDVATTYPLVCEASTDCTVYVHTDGRFHIAD